VTDYAAHPVEDRLGVLSRMDMTVLVMMRSVTVDVCMSVFVSVLIYMCVLMKMLVCMGMTVLVII
jgi:hypothetical protein